MQVTTQVVKTRKEAQQIAAEIEARMWLENPGAFEVRIEANLGSSRVYGYLVKTIVR